MLLRLLSFGSGGGAALAEHEGTAVGVFELQPLLRVTVVVEYESIFPAGRGRARFPLLARFVTWICGEGVDLLSFEDVNCTRRTKGVLEASLREAFQ